MYYLNIKYLNTNVVLILIWIWHKIIIIIIVITSDSPPKKKCSVEICFKGFCELTILFYIILDW